MSDLILVVDDEEEMRDIVRTLLELNGFEVIEAKNASEMYEEIAKNTFSLIVLDIGLPESDGLTAMKKMRVNYDVPIVLLTGKGDIIDKVLGLELGADDYITKPFHSHELIARIKSVLRRSSPKNITDSTDDIQSTIYFNGWRLDTNSRDLFNPQKENIMITGHEYSILLALIRASGRPLTREQLLDSVGNGRHDHSSFDRSLDVMVAKLRKKLGDNPKTPNFIRTVRNSGYMFIAEIT